MAKGNKFQEKIQNNKKNCRVLGINSKGDARRTLKL